MKDAADQYTAELLPLPNRGELAQAFSDFTRNMVTRVQLKVSGQTVYDGPPVWAKRGRGRPRLANPLTPAERARRYRQRKSEANTAYLFGIKPPKGYKYRYFCDECGWHCTQECVTADIAAFKAKTGAI